MFQYLIAPSDEMQSSVPVLSDCRIAFDPIAAIHIADAFDHPVGCVMYMPANDAVGAAAFRFLGNSMFEFADEIHGSLYTVFQIGGKRPISETETPPYPVQRMIAPQREFVGTVTKESEPSGIADDHIKLIAMHDEKTPAIGRFMDCIAMDFDAAKIHAAIIAQRFIVIAGDENDARSLAHFPEEFLQNIIMRLRPDRAAFHTPEIDNVADKINGLCVVYFQKV